MISMKPITNWVDTIYKTGVVINTSNFKHPFASELNAAISEASCAKSELQSAINYTAVHPAFAKSASEQNTSLRWHPSVEEHRQITSGMSDAERLQYIRKESDKIDERIAGTFKIPLGRGELLGLMQAIESAISEGEHPTVALINALENQVASHTREGGGTPGSGDVDFLYINLTTGEVKHAAGRVGTNSCGCFGDMAQTEDAVWDLAYDFQRFMQLRIFGNTEGMSEEEIEAEIADILGRQSEKDYSRFIDHPYGYQCDCCDYDEEEPEPDEERELIDDFIATVGEHQDRLHEEYARLKGQSQYCRKFVDGEIDLVHVTQV